MSQALDKAKACVDQCVRDWGKTTLSDLELYSREMFIIWGMTDMALRFLNFNDYNAFKEYVYQEYGCNLGGTTGDYAEMRDEE